MAGFTLADAPGGEGAGTAGKSGMAAVMIDGERVPLTSEGLASISGTRAEVAAKLAVALTAFFTKEVSE